MAAHYQEGDLCNNIILVFSCPGRIEEIENRPCAGATGRNMEQVLRFLNQKKPDIFKSDNRMDYRITNAYSSVLFMKKSNRTEATTTELHSSDNINRLNKELKNGDIIICFGRKASDAVKMALPAVGDVLLIDGLPHLGNQAVNQAWKSDDLLLCDCVSGFQRRMKRLELISEIIIAKLTNNSEKFVKIG